METLAEHVLRPLASISLMVHLYLCYSEVSISKTCCPHFVLEGTALHPAIRDPEFCPVWKKKSGLRLYRPNAGPVAVVSTVASQ